MKRLLLAVALVTIASLAVHADEIGMTPEGEGVAGNSWTQGWSCFNCGGNIKFVLSGSTWDSPAVSGLPSGWSLTQSALEAMITGTATSFLSYWLHFDTDMPEPFYLTAYFYDIDFYQVYYWSGSAWSLVYSGAISVPEPATMLLLGLALPLFFTKRRKFA